MKLEDCKKCSYHYKYLLCQVHCCYWETYAHSIVTFQDRRGTITIVGCPKELNNSVKNSKIFKYR